MILVELNFNFILNLNYNCSIVELITKRRNNIFRGKKYPNTVFTKISAEKKKSFISITLDCGDS